MRATLPSGSAVEIAGPESTAGRFGVVIAVDAWGLRSLVDQKCAWLADQLGWVVAAPQYADFGGASAAERSQLVATLTDDQVLGDLVAAADMTGCAHVAMLGFCLGGFYALKSCATGRFSAVVSCYGTIKVPEHWRAVGQGEPVDALRRAQCPVLDIVAGRDAHAAPADHIDALRDLPGVPVVVYPSAGHGFVHDLARPPGGYARYTDAAEARFIVADESSDAADAWSRIIGFLRSTVAPTGGPT